VSLALAQYEAADSAKRLRIDRILRNIPPTFRAWNERVQPAWRWDWPHLALLQETLEQVTAGTIRKLIIQMPPRHGKSETATVRYPVYRLLDEPTTRVIVGAYNVTLAAKFGRKARAIAQLNGVPLSDERAAAEDWETAAGGGVRAVGVGSGVTGHGGDLIIIDDPVKSREEAESATYREKVWSWYTDDLYTRREPGAAMILIMTRWHSDDLAGRILASEDGPNWTVLSLPALAEENDPLGRPEGSALCPDRYDETALADIRLAMGEYGFSALYQQRPRPREGNMFPRDKATIVDALPAGLRQVRYWDKGGTQGGGDPTSGVRMGWDGQHVYVIDLRRGQLEAYRRNALMKQTADLEPGVAQRVEQEPGSGGKESAETSVRLLAGHAITVDRPSGDKVVRADPFAAQWQAGNVRLLRGPWNREYLDELEQFPTGKHDDCVDASSGAFNYLTLGARANIRSLD
jgi:predicted phage terminase large subunit-like protein